MVKYLGGAATLVLTAGYASADIGATVWSLLYAPKDCTIPAQMQLAGRYPAIILRVESRDYVQSGKREFSEGLTPFYAALENAEEYKDIRFEWSLKGYPAGQTLFGSGSTTSPSLNRGRQLHSGSAPRPMHREHGDVSSGPVHSERIGL